MEEWEESLTLRFLRVDEGPHIVTIEGPPEKVVNTFGKEQWVFIPALLDGMKGKLSPPKQLLQMISQVKNDHYNGKYPVKFQFERVGMDVKDTKIKFLKIVHPEEMQAKFKED